MNFYFFDSSALVKQYVDELGSDHVESLIEAGNSTILIARITQVEVAAALARRLKTGNLVQSDVDDAGRSFRYDLIDKYFVVEITKALLDKATALVTKYALRAYDAVQLAVALDVANDIANRGMSPLVLVSADIELNAAAQLEGLLVEDPNDFP